MSFERVSVIGLGYIGLPTAAMFASRKKLVVGVDVNPKTVDTINRGEIHIVEPELDMIVHAAVTEGYLRATLEPEPADAFLIAVPTPFKTCSEKDIPEPDLTYIESAAKAIAPVLKKGDLVILESTSPVGATENMAKWLADVRTDLTFPQSKGEHADINVAHCPERVLPGQVVRELVQNDRVIGGMSSRCSERAVELYGIFVQGECVTTNARTAEMAKLTENSCRDVQIAFANELSMICDELAIDVWELISLANRHPRINILQPGPGVGGHCIAVDPWFIVARAEERAPLIRQAREVNDIKPYWVIDKVKSLFTDFLLANNDIQRDQVTIGVFGLAFKANIDDLRESPSMKIAEELSAIFENQVRVVEPNIKKLPAETKGRLTLVSTAEGLESDILVILVDHSEFYKKHLFESHEYIVDTKGILRQLP